MNEQRIQAYFQLIEALLSCPRGQEGEIFAANSELVDSGLVQVMVAYAEHLTQEGEENAAQFLLGMAQQLGEVLGMGNNASSSKVGQSPQDYFTFLMRIFWAIDKSEGNPQVIYPIFQERLHLMNETLGEVLQYWATETFPKASTEEAELYAATIGLFSNLIQQFPLGKRAVNLELAIIGYTLALEVYTRNAYPEHWAGIQNNLANAYSDRIFGERAENIEESIRYYELALQVYTRTAYLEYWAMTQNNLASAYRDRILGKRAENIEESIRRCQLALQVCTRPAYPENWADLQNNLANAYLDRILGERAENIEESIRRCQLALQVHTRPNYPEEWARTQNSLANAYRNRILGERAENIEEAIRYYELALEVYTRPDYPEDWAMTQYNLATAYYLRIRGDRAENIEKSIRCFTSALEVYTYTAYPEDWAMTQSSLASAYRDRIRGERADNIEKAIRRYRLALKVRTRTDYPEQWAMTQHNLANVYLDRISGKRVENIEEAIRGYQLALKVRTRTAYPEKWAMTQSSLASAYRDRILGEDTENIEEAIHRYTLALRVYTSTAYPEQWAVTQNNLAIAYSKIGEIPKAIEGYRLALELFTPTAFPLDCLQSGRNLGNTAFKAGNWTTAIEGYEKAIQAVETSRSWATNDTRRQEILEESIGIYEKMVQACIHAGDLQKAFITVERSRSKRLVDLMKSKDLYNSGEIPAEVETALKEYELLQRQIDALRFPPNSNNRELEKTSSRSRVQWEAETAEIQRLERDKQEKWEQLRKLDPVLAGEVQVSVPDFTQMQELLDSPQTAILSFYTAENDTHIFILRHPLSPSPNMGEGLGVRVHTCTGQGLENLQDWIYEQWLRPYIADKTAWNAQISDFLSELAQRLHLNNLIEEHLEGIEELILIPHLFLHVLPLGAMPVDAPSVPLNNGETQENTPVSKESYFGDAFTIRMIPSCQVLEFCAQRPNVTESTYGTVEDATEDLPCAHYEGQKVAQMHNIPENLRLRGRQNATVRNYGDLARNVQYLHSSHHAGSRLDNPLESLLLLGDGSITLGQLLSPGWRLPQLIEVFLSCCETGLGLSENLTDDILTIAGGFLCAGARSVISTLWAVDQLSTSLFCIFYYQERQAGHNRPVALQRAQKRLREFTGKELQEKFAGEMREALSKRKEGLQDKAKAVKEEDQEKWKQYKKLRRKVDNTQTRLEWLCTQEFPFASPQYWSAFVCQGLR